IWPGSRLLPYAAYSTPRRVAVSRPRTSYLGRHSRANRARSAPGRRARMRRVTRVVIIGGGPGGYEAALVAAQLGGEVTLIDSDGIGGSAVLTDCVPSKTLIATAEVMTEVSESAELGIRFAGDLRVDLEAVNQRVLELAAAQSADIAERLARARKGVAEGQGS